MEIFKNKWLLVALFVLIASVLFSGCNHDNSVDNPVPVAKRGDLIKVEQRAEFSPDVLNALALSYGLTLNIDFSVKAYRIEYRTVDLNEIPIIASGLLIVPVKNDTLPIVSYQHPTCFTKSEGAYSDIASIFAEGYGPALYGMAVFISDYIGFGASSAAFHPYLIKKAYGNACVDMLRAGCSFFDSSSIKYDKNIFLMGYSEGGYATIALANEIEQYYNGEFSIKACSAGGGAYNIIKTTEYYTNADTAAYPAYLAYVLKSYKEYFNIGIGIDAVFNMPYSARIDSLFDGYHSGEEINEALSYKPQELFRASFINGFNGSEFQSLKNPLTSNSIYEFLPEAPLLLGHAKYDECVPYFNSLDFYNSLMENGKTNVVMIDNNSPAMRHAAYATEWYMTTMILFKAIESSK
jgi:hypothetical protein